jgi:hypothetical protein
MNNQQEMNDKKKEDFKGRMRVALFRENATPRLRMLLSVDSTINASANEQLREEEKDKM